jgi:hypothetical protein
MTAYGNYDLTAHIEKGRTKHIGTFDTRLLSVWMDSFNHLKSPVELRIVEHEYPQYAIAAREVGSDGGWCCICPVVIEGDEE